MYPGLKRPGFGPFRTRHLYVLSGVLYKGTYDMWKLDYSGAKLRTTGGTVGRYRDVRSRLIFHTRGPLYLIIAQI